MPEFTVKVTGLTEIVQHFKTLDRRARQAVADAERPFGKMLRSKLRDDARGGVFEKHTGDLAKAAFYRVKIRPDSVVTTVGFSGRQAGIAAALERGFTARNPGGTPYFNSLLLGRTVYVSKWSAFANGLPVTKPHNVTVHAREFIEAEFSKVRGDIADAIEQAVRDACVPK